MKRLILTMLLVVSFAFPAAALTLNADKIAICKTTWETENFVQYFTTVNSLNLSVGEMAKALEKYNFLEITTPRPQFINVNWKIAVQGSRDLQRQLTNDDFKKIFIMFADKMVNNEIAREVKNPKPTAYFLSKVLAQFNEERKNGGELLKFLCDLMSLSETGPVYTKVTEFYTPSGIAKFWLQLIEGKSEGMLSFVRAVPDDRLKNIDWPAAEQAAEQERVYREEMVKKFKKLQQRQQQAAMKVEAPTNTKTNAVATQTTSTPPRQQKPAVAPASAKTNAVATQTASTPPGQQKPAVAFASTKTNAEDVLRVVTGVGKTAFPMKIETDQGTDVSDRLICRLFGGKNKDFSTAKSVLGGYALLRGGKLQGFGAQGYPPELKNTPPPLDRGVYVPGGNFYSRLFGVVDAKTGHQDGYMLILGNHCWKVSMVDWDRALVLVHLESNVFPSTNAFGHQNLTTWNVNTLHRLSPMYGATENQATNYVANRGFSFFGLFPIQATLSGPSGEFIIDVNNNLNVTKSVIDSSVSMELQKQKIKAAGSISQTSAIVTCLIKRLNLPAAPNIRRRAELTAEGAAAVLDFLRDASLKPEGQAVLPAIISYCLTEDGLSSSRQGMDAHTQQ